MTYPACLRPDTNDAAVWQSVYEEDEYRVGDLAGLRVLDAGAHVGSFARKCLDAGAHTLICVEPNTDTRRVLAEVLEAERRDGRAFVLGAAVWDGHGMGWLVHCRRERSGDTLVLHEGPGEEVRLLALAHLLEHYRPDAVKLDVEGAEYTCLEGLTFPDYVRTLWVEFHEADRNIRRFVRQMNDVVAQGFTPKLLKEFIPQPDRLPLRNFAYLYRFDRK